MGWINSLRALAAMAVIMIHVAAPTVTSNLYCGTWWVGHGLDTLSRFAVPMFLMITGALLLYKDEPIHVFAKKRLWKIALPFLGWSLFYYFLANGSNGSPLDFIKDLLGNGNHYHLWYFYLIIFLYLFIPVLRKVVASLPTSYILYYALITGGITTVTCFLGWLGMPLKIFATPFSGGVAFLLLGYAIAHRGLRIKHLNWIGWTSVVFIYFGTYLIVLQDQKFNGMFYEVFGIFVMMQAVMIFAYVYENKERFNKVGYSKVVHFISTYSFGVYLIHPYVIKIVNNFLPHYLFTIPYGYVGFIVKFLAVLGLSLLPVWAISKIPVIRKFV